MADEGIRGLVVMVVRIESPKAQVWRHMVMIPVTLAGGS